MKKNIKYNIALDIGVASVGWSVTDQNNNLLKKGGKNMWGVRIFPEGQTASKRRGFRSARRRLNRRKERINLLQKLLLEDIEETDENFIPRLKETSLAHDDKTISKVINGKKYNLFSDNLTDKEYYNEESGGYPTIYHLRNALVESKDKFDIRLVYLAIHHIIKYRGNFLYEGDFQISDTKMINDNLELLLVFLNENLITLKENNKVNDIITILKDKYLSKAIKKENIIKLFDFETVQKKVITQVFNAILGFQFNLNTIFNLEIEKPKIYFSKEIEDEENILKVLEIHDYLEYFELLRRIYSWQILQSILQDETSISKAFINKYIKYGKDLKLLKSIYKRYFDKDEYKIMYKNMFINRIPGSNNYVEYNKPMDKKGNYDDFKKQLLKEIKENFNEKEENIQTILKELKNDEFLIKLRVVENVSIPHQLHKKELEQILENQSKYYQSIKKNKDKIISLLTFRIPYYIGPLALKKEDVNVSEETHCSKWAWIVRNSNDKIRPWNFEEIVDVNASAEEFIKRMLGNCTYLTNQKVMPKNSLLYSEFNVLQELNNIRLNGKKLDVRQKQKVIDELFKTKKIVTKKSVENLFKNEGMINAQIEGLSSMTKFNSSLSSYIDMTRIFGEINDDNYNIIEEIIYWITIFEEKSIIKSKIQEKYQGVTEKELNEILKLRYTGWSRLSKELIDGIRGVDEHDKRTIIEILREDDENFMQIINNKDYPFKQIIENSLIKSEKITYVDIDELQTSPANKRAIWQAIRITKEIVSVIGNNPENIYIEFAREEGIKGKQTDKRKERLNKIYKSIEDSVESLYDYDDKVFSELRKVSDINDRLYLYFLQNGKCMYTEEALNIDELEFYHIDHIKPQSFIVDNSLDNKVLVKSKSNVKKSDNLYLDRDLINKRQKWWKSMFNNGLMTQSKYFNLLKGKNPTDFSEEMFIKRQLVETRQIIKHVTNIFKNMYNESNILAIRASLVNNFRNKYKVYKIRELNNFHHAHDAYILSIIGNTINKEWKIKEEFVYNEYVKKYLKQKKGSKEITEKEKHGIIMQLVDNVIKSNSNLLKKFKYKDYFFSRMLIENKGEFYNQTLYSPKSSKKELIPVKNKKDAQVYGGYSNVNNAYSVVFSYVDKKGFKQYELIGIPIQVSYDINAGVRTIEDYIEGILVQRNIKYRDVKLILRKILKYQEYIDEDNNRLCFLSNKEITITKPLFVNQKVSELLYKINKNKEIEEKEYIFLFDYLLEKLKNEYTIYFNIYINILNARAIYLNLDTKDKNIVIINGFLALMSGNQGNFTKLKLSERAGRQVGKRFMTKKLQEMKFINKSITGIYERKDTLNELESCGSE